MAEKGNTGLTPEDRERLSTFKRQILPEALSPQRDTGVPILSTWAVDSVLSEMGVGVKTFPGASDTDTTESRMQSFVRNCFQYAEVTEGQRKVTLGEVISAPLTAYSNASDSVDGSFYIGGAFVFSIFQKELGVVKFIEKLNALSNTEVLEAFFSSIRMEYGNVGTYMERLKSKKHSSSIPVFQEALRDGISKLKAEQPMSIAIDDGGFFAYHIVRLIYGEESVAHLRGYRQAELFSTIHQLPEENPLDTEHKDSKDNTKHDKKSRQEIENE